MLSIQSGRFRQLVVLTAGLMLISLAAFALAQGKKEEPKPKMKDALVRVGNNGVRLKDASKFEIVKQGDSGGYVLYKATKERLGAFGCGSCAGQDRACMFWMNSDGKSGSCTGCSQANSCTLNPF
jgi:hypothetical protein